MLRSLLFLLGIFAIFYSLISIVHRPFVPSINGNQVNLSALSKLPAGKHRIEIEFENLPKVFHFRVDDCLESLTVNETKISNFSFPFCDYSKEGQISFEGIPKLPWNRLVAEVSNNAGDGNFHPFINYLHGNELKKNLVLAFGFFLVFLAIGLRSTPKIFLLYLSVGLFFRAFVATVIPLDKRSSDFDGHVEYVEYLLKYWKIPPVAECWQCYQPPSFYFIEAFFTSFIGHDPRDFSGLLTLPLIFSFFSCYISIQLFRFWIPNPSSSFFILPLLLLPGSLIAEISFNNDSLTVLLSLLILLAGSRWYDGRNRYATFLSSSLLVPFGVLSKLSISAIVIWWYSILLLRRSFKGLIIAGVLLASITAPYFIYRFQTENKIEAVGNIGNLNDKLKVSSNLQTFLRFSPFEMVEKPFVDPWQDGFHREYFFEYLFLSSIFLENSFQMIAPAPFPIRLAHFSVGLLLACLIIVTVLLLLNFKRVFRSYWPILLCLLLSVITLALNRFSYPYSCSNNFRYISTMSVAIGIIMAGVMELWPKPLRMLIGLMTLSGILLAWYSILLVPA